MIKNNILVCYKQSGSVFRIDGQISDSNNINYNLYYAPNSSKPCTYNGRGKTWSEWKNLGFEGDGHNSNPLLKDISNREFGLLTNSSAIDSGANLDSLFNKDKDGVFRPQGNGWDLGAYEFIGTSQTLQPPRQLRAKIINP